MTLSLSVRDATVEDAGTILGFIKDLAVFENAGHEVEATVESIQSSVFGPQSVSKAIVCEIDGVPIGFAIWFLTYSTWTSKNGIYLEDLYVAPEHRGAGAGRFMLKHLAGIAVENGYARFEWSVLDWNEPAIRTYEAVGAKPQGEWIRYRLAGKALRTLAAD